MTRCARPDRLLAMFLVLAFLLCVCRLVAGYFWTREWEREQERIGAKFEGLLGGTPRRAATLSAAAAVGYECRVWHQPEEVGQRQ